MVKAHPKPPQMKIIKAGGALVWRLRAKQDSGPATVIPKSSDQIEVLLVHRPKYNDWAWPKGKREANEPLATCAVREVEEETGYPIRLGAPLTTQRYQLGSGTVKEVHYWVGHLDVDPAALTCRPPVTPAPSSEIDRIRWVPPSRAMRLLTRRGDRRLLEELVSRLQAQKLLTRTVIFLRHADALPREQWGDQHENKRPLSRKGANQIPTIVSLLSAWGVGQLRTSPWRRCLATVAGYATLSNASLETAAELTEDAYRHDQQALRKVVASWLNQPPDQPLAVCVHRPTIPGIIGQLALNSPNSLGHKFPKDSPYLKPGGMLVAHLAVQSATEEVADSLGKVSRASALLEQEEGALNAAPGKASLLQSQISPAANSAFTPSAASAASVASRASAATVASKAAQTPAESRKNPGSPAVSFISMQVEEVQFTIGQARKSQQEKQLPPAGPARVMAASRLAAKRANSAKTPTARQVAQQGSATAGQVPGSMAASPKIPGAEVRSRKVPGPAGSAFAGAAPASASSGSASSGSAVADSKPIPGAPLPPPSSLSSADLPSNLSSKAGAQPAAGEAEGQPETSHPSSYQIIDIETLALD